MNIRSTSHARVRKMVVYAMLAAITVALQMVCTFIKFGPFSITLALFPISVGAAIYGWRCGAFLGFVFSAVVYITGLMGLDGGFVNMMMNYNAIGTTVLCLLKGTAAGAAAGLVYRPVAKKLPTLASMLASLLTPIVNTGLFALGIMTVFYGFLSQNAGGEAPIAVLFLGWIGVNFIVEFATNMVLGTALTRVVSYFNHKMK